MTKDNKDGPNLNHPQECIKLANISCTNTVINPRTMVIISVDTSFTNVTMELVFLLVSTLCAEWNFQAHQRLRGNLFGMLSDQQYEKRHR